MSNLYEVLSGPGHVSHENVVPKPLVDGIDNFSENVEYPRRLVADLCMGEGALAWDATKRFLINTTIGVHDDNSSLSDTFACWGVPAGPQLALPFMPRGPALDSLRALCFAPLNDDSFWWEPSSVFNDDFSKRIDVRTVEVASGVEAKYSFIGAPETADGAERLVVVVPGIGAGRTSPEVVAMGEFLQGTGRAVVLCDSVFHWESMRTVNLGVLPGNLTEDAKRFGVYLKRLLEDLRGDGRVRNPEVSVIGWSMGGLTTLHLAALDERGLLPVDVKRFVAINPPPTSFERGLKPFAKVMDASRSWTREKAWENFGSVVGALYGWVTQRHPRYDPANPPKDEEGEAWCYSPNLTEEQANYLIGLTLRRCLLSLVAERHRSVPFPWIKSELTWFRREAFYEEVGEMRLDDYLCKYLAACYPDLTVEQLRAATEVRAQADVLKRCRKLSLVHTWNDPLLVDEDRCTLDDLFGDRITWFADGAHCGYFYAKPFQDELLRLLP